MLRRLRRLIREAVGRAAPPAPGEAPSRRPPSPPAPEDDVEQQDIEVEAATVAEWAAQGRAPQILDIREIHEVQNGHLADSTLIPMNRVPAELAALRRDQPLVVACAAGVRSYGVAWWLREQGFADAWSLIGGVGALVEVGARWAQPPWPPPPLQLTWPVRLSPAQAAALGLDPEAVGTVQAVEAGPRYTVGFAEPEGGMRRIAALGPEDLIPVAGR